MVLSKIIEPSPLHKRLSCEEKRSKEVQSFHGIAGRNRDRPISEYVNIPRGNLQIFYESICSLYASNLNCGFRQSPHFSWRQFNELEASLNDAHDTAGTSANLATLATAKLAYYSSTMFSSSFFSFSRYARQRSRRQRHLSSTRIGRVKLQPCDRV